MIYIYIFLFLVPTNVSSVKIVKHFKPTKKLEELQDKMAETKFVTLKGKKISNNLAHVECTVPF